MHYWAVSCFLHEVIQTRVKEKPRVALGFGTQGAPMHLSKGWPKGKTEDCKKLTVKGFWLGGFLFLACVLMMRSPDKETSPGSNPGLLHCMVDYFLSEPSGKPHIWATWCGKMSIVCWVWGWNTGSDEYLWVNCHEAKQAAGSLCHILSIWENPLFCPSALSLIPTHPPVLAPPPVL